MSYVVSGFEWSVNGSVNSTSTELYTVLPPGVNRFLLIHYDFLGRMYTSQGTIAVLSPADYDQFVAAVNTGGFPLL
jgi:hypothetical protein